jgi:hypothetical protein
MLLNPAEEDVMNDPLPSFPTRATDARPSCRPAPSSEFDTLLTRSDDHAGVRAVEVELRRHEIPFSRVEGTEPVRRPVELQVRAADHTRASHLAAMIFTRRLRLERAFPRPRPMPEMPGPSPGGGIDGLPGCM